MLALSQTISPDIFGLFPGYLRGIVVAKDLQNGPSSNEITALLREAENGVRSRLPLENLIEDDHIKPWREAFRVFGVKPSEFRPSIEGLVRRTLHGDSLPSINTLVDIGNILSLNFLLPVGGHSLDHLSQDMTLRIAAGNEEFTPFGSSLMEHPLSGEVIFSEGNIVLTRRWVWRQSNHTLTLPETTSIEFNIDGLPPVTSMEIEKACEQMMEYIKKFCGGKSRFEILSESNPRIELSV